jgi:ribosomal protein S1
MSVEDCFASHFGDYLSDSRRGEWERLKSQLRGGERLTGKVVARLPFGVFVDVGVGFPALILVPDFEGAAARPYTSLDMYPAVGATVSGAILLIDDRHRQIRLVQRTLSPEDLAAIGSLIPTSPAPGG